MKVYRISKRRLEEYDRILGERDKSILRSLRKLRYLTANQIRRLHYTDNATLNAAQRATRRMMSKLQGYGVVESLERRIGGVRAGSNAFVWTLTEAGVHLLHLNDPEFSFRKRGFEPSLNFLNHTLAVSEVYIQLKEVCRRYQLGLVRAEMEPECWRGYTGEDGKPATMKPDMFAVTANGDYEDSWFIEVDLATESPNKIVSKCCRYVHYCKSGIEQKEHDVFPLVVWLVYNENRKTKLQQYIADCRDIPEASKAIFTVIMPYEFDTLIRGGVAALAKNHNNEAKQEGAKCA